MPLTKNEILATLEREREAVRAFGVTRLALFGSALRGEVGEASDLDFVVVFDRVTFDAYMGRKEFLEERFGRKVDLVIEEDLKPVLRETVLRDMVDVPGL